MRRAFRALALVLAAYLTQAIFLSDFKIAGVMLDVVTLTLYACGDAMGLYAGIASGLLGALILETVGGDLAGMTSVVCVTAGAWGAWVSRRLAAFELVGNRKREKYIKRFTPMLAAGAFIVVKELLHLAYFYLTGVDIAFIHIFRVLFAGVWGAVAALVLLPLYRYLLLRRPEDTLLARRRRRRKEEKEAAEAVAAATPDKKGKKKKKKKNAPPPEEAVQPETPIGAPEVFAPAGAYGSEEINEKRVDEQKIDEQDEGIAPSGAPDEGGTDA